MPRLLNSLETSSSLCLECRGELRESPPERGAGSCRAVALRQEREQQPGRAAGGCCRWSQPAASSARSSALTPGPRAAPRTPQCLSGAVPVHADPRSQGAAPGGCPSPSSGSQGPVSPSLHFSWAQFQGDSNSSTIGQIPLPVCMGLAVE